MTRDDIIVRMGWMPSARHSKSDLIDRIEKIVRVAERVEREACAKVVACMFAMLVEELENDCR